MRKSGYKERSDKQLISWLNGKSIHNKIDNECCPDFSCCVPKLKAPKKIREKFYNAEINHDDELVNMMLVAFLDKMIEKTLPKGRGVRIIS